MQITPDSIAGAVTRHIRRTEVEPGFLAAEGVAFKAHLAAKGANLRAMLREPHADYFVMRALTDRKARRYGKYGWSPRQLAQAETDNPLELPV